MRIESSGLSPEALPPDPRSRSWLIPLLSMLLVLSSLLALGTLLISWRSSPEPPSIRGVRLGMTADQIRARFDRGTSAAWRTEVSGTDLTLIRAPAGDLDRETRFEIHDGMLVAIRLDVPDDRPEASGEPLATTPASLTARTRSEPGRTQISVLARDCPTHAQEVARILGEPR